MRPVPTFLTLLFAIILTSCGDSDKKTEITENKQEASNSTSNGNISSSDTKNARWEARKAKGDTLAMPYKELQAYFPDISGYTKDGGPQGRQANVPGMGSWSETSQEYTSGDKHLSIKLMDYNAAWQAFQGVTMAYSMGFSSEDDEKKQEQANLGIKDVYAYQTTYKTQPKSQLAVVIADRFFITLESDGENGDTFLRDVAKNMKLDKLAAM